MTEFDTWARWKETQTSPTCDEVGCYSRNPIWHLEKNNVFFCAQHGAELGGTSGMEAMYGEVPVYLPASR